MKWYYYNWVSILLKLFFINWEDYVLVLLFVVIVMIYNFCIFIKGKCSVICLEIKIKLKIFRICYIFVLFLLIILI